MEATALLMLPEAEGGSELPAGSVQEGSGVATEEPGGALGGAGLGLEALTAAHLPAVKELIAAESESGGEPDAPHHGQAAVHRHGQGHGSPDPDAAYTEIEALALQGRSWTVLQRGRPVAVLARQDGGDGEHDLLDFAVARAGEAELSLALRRAGKAVRGEGRWPAAVIDADDPARRRIFRQAGYYSAAAYMVFYDPEAGRPSVGVVSVEEMQAMIDKKERFRLVDVLGEEHWNEGHLPTSEWIDFRVLAKEAHRRFGRDEPLVLYCKGFT
jgi:hypothetical protein